MSPSLVLLFAPLCLVGQAELEGTVLGSPPPTHVVAGNRAIPSALYLALIESWIRERGELEAAALERELEDFLRAAGFVVAVVRVVQRAGRFEIFVDEGTIERVTFPGQSGLTAAIASSVFQLEDQVFEESAFRSELRQLEGVLGRRVLGFQMSATSTAGLSILSLRQVRRLSRAVGVPAAGRWVLTIDIEAPVLAPGWGLGLSATGPDGLIVELRHRWAEVAATEDRVQADGEVGLRFGELLGGGDKPLLSRLGLGLRWLSPPVEPSLRGLLEVRATYLDRQRLDLDGSTYDLLDGAALLGLSWVPSPLQEVRAHLGVDHRSIVAQRLGLTGVEPEPIGVRAFAELAGELALELDSAERLDQRLTLEGRLRGFVIPRAFGQVHLEASQSFPIGRYDDLRLQLSTVALLGRFGVLEEVRVSDLLRGLYGDLLYTSAAVTLGAEVFLSLDRELLRASAFALGIAEGGSRFDASPPRARPGLSGGLGLHGLLLSTFQGSVHVVVGVLEERSVDAAVNLSLTRLF